MTAPATRETADHAELARDIRALCNGHPHAKIAWPHRELHALADRAENLLSEIAALRGERDGLRNRVSCLERLGGEQSTRVMEQATRAKDAERQRDELRKAMPDLSSVIAWLDNGCEPKHAVTELSIYKARIDQALANQGADQ